MSYQSYTSMESYLFGLILFYDVAHRSYPGGPLLDRSEKYLSNRSGKPIG